MECARAMKYFVLLLIFLWPLSTLAEPMKRITIGVAGMMKSKTGIT
jgi:hypothetical protein